jgi:hypothetical protein
MSSTLARATAYVPPSLTPVEELAGSRCDRCNAEARVLVALGRLRLALCGHHYRRQEDALATSDWRVVADSRPELAK